jgi:iron complex transport system permease protein
VTHQTPHPATGRRRIALIPMLVGLLALVIIVSVSVGAVMLPLSRVVSALLQPTTPSVEATDAVIVWEIRFGRVLLAALIGAGLAVSGAALQGLFRNPLADPFVIGASSGAALGATLAIVTGFGPVSLAAFAGSLLAVAAAYSIAEMGGVVPATALLLAGAALNTFLSAIVSLVMLLNEQSTYAVLNWLLGGLAGRGWPQLWASVPYMGIGLGVLWWLARPLDALAFGDETARSLGLPLGWACMAIVAATSLTTAAAVAAGGTIGFVGLIAPHAARLLVGANHAHLIPASALLGALLLLLADDVARTILAPLELPAGVLTAAFGGPFFLYLLKTHQRAVGARR